MLNRKESNQIRDILKSNNIKVTLPRICIYKILKDSEQGLTAYEVENRSIEKNNRINLATIYSTLKIFQNLGLVQRYKAYAEQSLYTLISPDSTASIRVICQGCNSNHIFQLSETDQYVEKICRNNILNLKSYQLLISVDSCQYCQAIKKSA